MREAVQRREECGTSYANGLPKQTATQFIHLLTSNLTHGREDPLRNRLREKRERVVLLVGWWEIRYEWFSPRADESGEWERSDHRAWRVGFQCCPPLPNPFGERMDAWSEGETVLLRYFLRAPVDLPCRLVASLLL